MKTIIFAFLMYVALGSKTVFFRTSKACDPNEVQQDVEEFESQFNKKFGSAQKAVQVTALKLENYKPLPKENKAPVKNINNFLLEKSRAGKALKQLIAWNTNNDESKETLCHEVVPVFKVEYQGSDLAEEAGIVDVEINHNGLTYEVARCSICLTDCSQNPKNICINKHSFCKDCLDEREKFNGKCCPNCRNFDMSKSTLTLELQTHFQNSSNVPEALGRAMIYLIFTTVLYLPYLLNSKPMGAGISHASGFAFQIYAGILGSYSVMPLYRQLRGQLVKSAFSTSLEGWKMMAIVLVSFISNIFFGVFTIGGWATFFGTILVIPLAVLLNWKFN